MTSADVPLIVDMDGTLLRTDALFEAIALALFRTPIAALLSVLWLFKGRAAFKHRIHALAEIDVAALPVHAQLVTYLERDHANGRAIHLVSASADHIVKAVGARFDVFTSAQGSTPELNLKGDNKRAWLQCTFPEGFAYAGDSKADLAVWSAAHRALLVGAGASVKRQAKRLSFAIEATIDDDMPSRFKTWRKALRLHQWSKNVLIFVPLFLGHRYTDVSAIVTCVLGFVCVGVVASATYMINDLSDLSADRLHRTKRHRPLASGDLPISSALLAAPLMIAAGLVGAALLSPTFAVVLGAYLVLTLTYSLSLKRMAIIDTVALAALYTLRILMGTALAATTISPWLLTFSLTFFLAMSLAKRHIELVGFETDDPKKLLPGRGYQAGDWPLTLALGVAASMAASVILALYVMEEAYPSGFYIAAYWLWALPVAVTLFSLRVWLLAHRGDLDDDPVAFAIKDKQSLLLGAFMALSFGAALLIQ